MMGYLVFVLVESYLHSDRSATETVFRMLHSLSPDDRKRTILCLVDWLVEPESVAEEFSEVRLFSVDTSVDRDRLLNGRLHPPARAYSNSRDHWRSAVIFRALAGLGEGSKIEYVEFPDRGGLAFCSLQERKLRNFLPDATIAVRLCSSYTQLMHAEAQAIDIERLNLSDLERKCLRDCDLVVTAVLSVAEATRSVFGFSVDEWTARVVEHAYLPTFEFAGAQSIAPASASHCLVFPSPLQRSQRPDLFVRAAASFLSTTPAYAGMVVLGPPGGDQDYASDIERLIPAGHAERFQRMSTTQAVLADALLRDATVVLSSSWDDFCPTAYRASQLGAQLILNEANPAFGVESPWQDGVNCLKFDGSVHGLVNAFKRKFERAEKLRRVEYPVRPFPWTRPRSARASWRRLADRPRVSVVVAHFNLGAYLSETLASLRSQSYGNIEIVLVDDASADPQSVLAIEVLRCTTEAGLNIIQLPGNVGLAAARNIGVRHATGTYVLTLDADDLIHPDFVAVGVEALENRREFDVVVTPAGYFLDGEPLPDIHAPVDFPDYAMFSGEAIVGGLIENRFSTATALFRKSALVRFPYLESLNCFEDWSLYLRMCEAGARFIVTNDVFFYYRRRRNSMVHSHRGPDRKRIEYSDLMRTSAPRDLKHLSRHLIIGLASPVAAVAESPASIPDNAMALSASPIGKGLFGADGAYDEQVVFAALKLSRWAERRLPWVINPFMWVSKRAWRAYRALRG